MSIVPTHISNSPLYLFDVPKDEAELIMPQLNGTLYVPYSHIVTSHSPDYDDFSSQSKIYHIEIGDDIIGLHNVSHYPKLFYYDRKKRLISAKHPTKAGIIDGHAYLLFERNFSLKEFFWSMNPRSRSPESPLKKMNTTIFQLLYREPR